MSEVKMKLTDKSKAAFSCFGGRSYRIQRKLIREIGEQAYLVLAHLWANQWRWQKITPESISKITKVPLWQVETALINLEWDGYINASL